MKQTMLKVGISLVAVIVAVVLAVPAQALIYNADVADNAGIAYGKLTLTKKITSKDIKNGTIKSKDIDDEAIETDNIEDGAVTGDKLADDIEITSTGDATFTGDVTLGNGDDDIIVDSLLWSVDVDGAAYFSQLQVIGDEAGLNPQNTIVFEGATGNDFETFLYVVDPTADRSITFPNVSGTVITTGDTATVTSLMIAADTIVAADIAADAVGASELADDSVASANIIADTIAAVDIATSGVATAEILDGTVTGGTAGAGVDIAADTITAANIATSGVATAEILNETILGEDIFDGTITAADLGADSVAASELADDSVDTGAIADGAVNAVRLQSAAADLGAANVTVNFGNTNSTGGTWNTNITTDGTMTAGGFYASSNAFDTTGAAVLHIGEVFASSISLGTIAKNTTVEGDLTITGGDVFVTGKATCDDAAGTAGQVCYDSVDGNLYVYDGIALAWQDMTAAAAGAATLDDAYNAGSGLQTEIHVDNGGLTLSSEDTTAGGGDIVVDLTSTGDFYVAKNGTAFATFNDSGNVALTGTLDVLGNVSDSGGIFTIADAANITGAVTLDGDVNLGNAAADVVTVTGTIAGASPLVFEGLTADAFETTFAITDGAVTTITFPATTGVVITNGDTATVTSAMIAVDTIVADDIATSAVTTTEILNGTVANADLTNDTIDFDKVIDAPTLDANLAFAGAFNVQVAAGQGFDTSAAGALNLGATNATSAVIGSAALASLTVTTTGTGTATVVLPDGAISTAEILDATVANADLTNDTIDFDKVIDAPTLDANLAFAGAFNVQVAAGQGFDTSAAGALNLGATNATSAVIGSGSLGSLTVTTNGTGTGEVVLPDGSISTAEILDATILTGDIAADTILAGNIADGAVATGEILDSTITTTDIAANTIIAGDIAADAIDGASLADSVTLDAAFALNGFDVTIGEDLNVNGDEIDADGTLDITGATGMNINTGGGDITLDPNGNDVLPGGNSQDNLGADATRWASIFADTLNYKTALTDGGAAGVSTITLGTTAADSVTINANTAITDDNWNVTNAGLANFVSVGAATAGTGKFTTLEALNTVNFTTSGESIVNSADTFTFTRNTSGAVTINAADDNADADLTVDAGGTGDITLGSAGSNVTVADTFTVTTGGATITAGGVTITDGGLNMTGDTISNVAIIGDGGDNVSIDSDDWDITTAGVGSGFTGFTSTGTVNFSGAVLRIDRDESADATNATAPDATCDATTLGSLSLVDENDAANVWLWACEETVNGGTYAWGRIN